MRLRDIAECVGVSERAAHTIVTDLVRDGYLTSHRVGRRNFYEVHADASLDHSLLADVRLGDLLRPLLRHEQERVA